MRGEVVTCSVCGADVGRGPGGLGVVSHANMHRREFVQRYGRKPKDYQEVRDKLHDPPGEQITIWESLTDPEQQSILDPALVPE